MKRHYILSALALVAFFSIGAYLFFHYDLHVFFSDRERAVERLTSYDPYDEIIFIALQILQVVFSTFQIVFGDQFFGFKIAQVLEGGTGHDEEGPHVLAHVIPPW